MKATFDFEAFRMAISAIERAPAGPKTRDELNPYIMENIVGPMEAGKDVRVHDVDYSKFTREDLKAALQVLCNPDRERRMQQGLTDSFGKVKARPSQRPMFI